MRQYALQSYFKVLCKSYDLARKEMKRLEVEEGAKRENWEKEHEFWHERLEQAKNEIEEVIEELVNNKMSIVVTTKEEVTALMSFFFCRSMRTYPIINTQSEFLQVFPKGDMCEEFYQAYCLQNKEKMVAVCEKYI